MPIKTYKELFVWQKAIQLVVEVYGIVKQLPKAEYYILGSQMLRAVISIPSNIAEGYLRRHLAEYTHFLSIALGSAGELETQLIITQKQYTHIDCVKANALLSEVLKMLYVMTEKMEVKKSLHP